MTGFDAQPGRPLKAESKLTLEQSKADDIDLQAGLDGLAGIVADSRGVDELLTVVAQFAGRAIPGVDGAGVTLLRPGRRRRRLLALAVTAEFVRELDVSQHEVFHEGPGVLCIQLTCPVVSGSLGDDPRWPGFGAQAARLDVNSALSLPLRIEDQVIGAINAYSRAADAFGEHELRLGALFAGPAAVSVHNAQVLTGARDTIEQLKVALVSRTVIDQTIGILRSRAGGSADEAFAHLRTISQAENVKLAVIAKRLVDDAVVQAATQPKGPVPTP